MAKTIEGRISKKGPDSNKSGLELNRDLPERVIDDLKKILETEGGKSVRVPPFWNGTQGGPSIWSSQGLIEFPEGAALLTAFYKCNFYNHNADNFYVDALLIGSPGEKVSEKIKEYFTRNYMEITEE